MIEAFVFGKFHPFHKGHEAMINFALTKCDVLTVLVCESDKERISGKQRRNWITETFEGIEKIEVVVYPYQESELPSTSQASNDASKAWAKVFKLLLPKAQLLITSEPYGPMVARHLEIDHIAFDYSRSQIPISASRITKDPGKYWNYLPNSVKPFFAYKVVLLGTESTSKSTLTQKLSSHYSCQCVNEAARDIIPNSESFSMDDLKTVAEVHAKNIAEAVRAKSRLVVIDTDIHITLSYSRFFFGKELTVNQAILEANRAHLYIYLNPDVPYVQDGTRLSESERNRLDQSHRQTLKEHGIEFIELKGNWDNRLKAAIKAIDAALLYME